MRRIDKPESDHSTSHPNTGRVRLIFAIVRRDMSQIHKHGLPALLFFSILILFLGILLFTMAKSTLNEIGVPSWTAQIGAENGGGAENVLASITLLHPVLAYAILATMILMTLVFSTGYQHEVKKGTIRTLACYPIGVLDITVAKLIYTAIAGLIFTMPVFFLPVLGLGKSAADLAVIYFVTYAITLSIIAVGAFGANSLTLITKRMYIQPPLFVNILMVISFFSTATILKLLSAAISFASPVFQALGTLTPFSPYHQDHLLLSTILGGTNTPNWLILIIPLVLVVLGVWLSHKVWPDIYEKE